MPGTNLATLAARLALLGVTIAAASRAAPPPPPPAVTPQQTAQAKKLILDTMARARRGDPAVAPNRSASLEERFAATYGMADDQAAWSLLRALQAEAPDTPWGDTGMGRIYVRWKLRDQADAAFARALRTAPGFSIALLERAIGKRKAGDAKGASDDLALVLQQDPNDARALLLKALLLDDAKAPPAERLAAYKAALAQAPQLYEAAAAVAALSEEQGDAASARDAVEKLAALSPRDGALWLRLAPLRKAAGDDKGSAEALEKALSLGAASKETLQELAALYRKLGRDADEQTVLQRLRRVDATDRGILVRLLELHRKGAETAAVEDDLRGLLELDPKDAGAHLALAGLRAKAGDLLGQLDELTAAAAGKAHEDDPEAAQKARAEEQALRDQVMVPKAPVTGKDVNRLQGNVARVLNAAYEKRRVEHPRLSGRLKLRVKVTPAGAAQSVDLTEDGVGDAPLAACAVLTLRSAVYPKGAGKTYSFQFDLEPPQAAQDGQQAQPAPHKRGQR